LRTTAFGTFFAAEFDNQSLTRMSTQPITEPRRKQENKNTFPIGVFTQLDGQLKSFILFTEYVFSRDYPYGALVESA
jgi:hypothetical protein